MIIIRLGGRHLGQKNWPVSASWWEKPSVLLLPSNAEFGDLRIVEVYDFYDFPRLFRAENSAGHAFIALSVEETSQTLKWLFVPLSSVRLEALSRGRMQLRNAFSSPETTAFMYDTLSTTATATPVAAADLSEDWLPAERALLVSDQTSVNTVREISPEYTMQIARHENRNVANIILKTPRSAEAAARIVGAIFQAVQDVLSALGQKVQNCVTERGAIQDHVLRSTQFNACAIFQGSVGLQLRADVADDLLQDSVAKDSMRLLHGLLSAKDDEGLLSNLLHEYRGRVGSKYKGFLETLVDAQQDVLFEWAAPTAVTIQTATLESQQLVRALGIVSQYISQSAEVIQVSGVLVGANSRTRAFELQENDSTKFVGRVAEEAMGTLEAKQINARYRATLRKLIEVSAATGEERTRWLLIGLE